MTINPTSTAIVVMDFQPTILNTLQDAGPLLVRVNKAIAATRAVGGTVATVRVAFTANDLAGFPKHSAMGRRMKSLADKVAADAPTTQIVPEIGVQQGDIAVRKIRVGPFLTTDLDAQLRKAGIDTVVFAGIHTSGCVLTGVRESHDLDYRVIVLSDGCADPDVEMHDFLVGKVFPKQSEVMTIDHYVTNIT